MMAKKFRSVWGEGTRPTITRRPPAGIASGTADSESGAAGAGTVQALFALKAMLDRGLIDRHEYETRKAEIEAGKLEPEG